MAKIERTKNASRNIVFGVILKAYQILVPFLMRTAMIYLMGVQYLGLNSLFTSVLQVLNLAELGVGTAMVYIMYKPIAEDDDTTICALMKLYRTYYRVIGLVIAIVGCALTPFIPHLIKSDVPVGINIYILYLLNLGATVLSYWLFAYKNSILQAHQRTDVVSKVTLVTSTVQYVLQLFVLWAFHNYYLYVIVALATQALTNIVTAVCADRLYPQFKPRGIIEEKKKREINQKIKDLFTAKIGYVVNTSVDSVVISAFLGLTVLAIYNNYFYIMNSIMGIIAVLFDSITAGIGNSMITESVEKNFNDLKKLTFIICWISTVCCCCFLNLYQPFMTLWVGEKLMLSYGYVVVMTVLFYVQNVRKVWVATKDAAGIWREDRFRPLITACANLTMNIILVRYIGLYGVMLSTIVAEVFISFPWLWKNVFTYVLKVDYREYLKDVIKYVVLCIICCIVTTFVCGRFNCSAFVSLIINGVMCLVIPNLILYLTFRNTNEFKATFLLLKNMVGKKQC